MKKLFLLTSICYCLQSVAGTGNLPVNSVLGDKSFVATYGYSPDNQTSEILRIQTHLQYVEKILEQTETTHLSNDQRARRNAIIAHLHEYWATGNFPSNFDYPTERRPCFIDKNGNICAVGYLIEKTVGRETAEYINSKHQYEYIAEMNESIVKKWATENGLTLEECAMIQPQYSPPMTPGDPRYYAEIKTGYGITSGVVGGINLATTISNFSHRSSNSNGMAYIGLITGATQIIMGAANIKQPTVDSYSFSAVTVSYKAQNNLSYFNIGMGTTTVISSVMRLVMNKKFKDSRNAFNLYSYPNANNAFNMGLTVTRRI